MKAILITGLSVPCGKCGAKISCAMPSRPVAECICPLCGETMYARFDHALKSALAYNKAVTDVMQCQQEYMVEFDG